MSRFLAIHCRAGLAGAAVCIACSLAPPVRADDLGRLFFTPQQRADLDKRRVSNVPVQEDAPVVREVLVTINGYVGRSSGKTTTWVNGVPQYDTVRSADPARLPIDAASGPQRVKVGATLDTTRGEARDVIGDGTIQVNPAPKR